MRSLAQVLVAALCALAAAGCGGGDSGEQSAGSDSVPTQAGPAPEAPGREQTPKIAGTSLDGEPLSLADYRGRPVLVNVWSSW